MKLIKPDTINFTASVTEQQIKDRMAKEVMEQIGALTPDGQPAPGVTAKVTRGSGRKGGYTIVVSGPAPARLLLPNPDPEASE